MRLMVLDQQNQRIASLSYSKNLKKKQKVFHEDLVVLIKVIWIFFKCFANPSYTWRIGFLIFENHNCQPKNHFNSHQGNIPLLCIWV